MPSNLLVPVLVNNAFDAVYAAGESVDERIIDITHGKRDARRDARKAKKTRVSSEPRFTVKETSSTRELPARLQEIGETENTESKIRDTVSKVKHDDSGSQDTDMQEAPVQGSGPSAGGVDHSGVDEGDDFDCIF